MPIETIKSDIYLKNDTAHATITNFRNETGLIEADIGSGELQLILNEATRDIRRAAYQKIEFELVSADSSDRYWVKHKYFADFNSSAGEVTLGDLEVYEAETVSSVGATLGWRGINRKYYDISTYIKSLDVLNGYFELQSGYPTNSRQIYVTYWFASKPIDKLQDDLKWACIIRAEIIALKRLWTRALKKGTTTVTLGKKTLTRDVNAFNELIKEKQKKYESYINYIKPFYGRSIQVGRGEIRRTPFQLTYN